MAREETAPAPASSRPPAGHRRVVLHCDADAFFCQVERQLHPELYGSVTALAVFQHGDVIAADAGAKKLGVKKRDSPADARRALVPRGGALAHVHVTEGHRVSYRPYDKASKAMHRVLRSREMKDTLLRVCGFRNADVRESTEERAERQTRDASSAESPLRSPSKARRGVVVEKASIDEAYVQLPSGCSLGAHAAACAHAVRRVVKQKTGLVLSVGAARNKTLAKFASAAAKPDGVKVVTEDDEFGPAASSRNRVGVGVGVGGGAPARLAGRGRERRGERRGRERKRRAERRRLRLTRRTETAIGTRFFVPKVKTFLGRTRLVNGFPRPDKS
mmetsp:Transcript_13485/g.56627  ORF Transcript_13485/g.56627 Transcript_13485/m.56627 type:complete len:332 (-) Transcript_13485:159-1154(-)